MSKLDFNRIKFEELEDRFEMEAPGGSCERKCAGGDGGDGGNGGGNGGNGGGGGTVEVETDLDTANGSENDPSLGTTKDKLEQQNP